MISSGTSATEPRVWQVGSLCRAIAGTLDSGFNPVTVRGEISGLARAASGHCYFVLKDEGGQLRCAMFRRAASLLEFTARDGELVEVRGRLDVYGPRGELQLIAESMSRAGQGALFEQFLRLKAKLDAQGLFEAARKRPLPAMPRGIGLVTSPGAAALHDVVTTLRRRVPHIPVLLVPAAVQGAAAPIELVQALTALYRQAGADARAAPVDLILLVRGGGSLEDLWAFNDERLAHVIAQSPVPVISGVGHETDFTIADFVADLRAPTPTAAAELAAQPREAGLEALRRLAARLGQSVRRRLDEQEQRLDQAASRLGRPSGLTLREQLRLGRQAQRLRFAMLSSLKREITFLQGLKADLSLKTRLALERRRDRLDAVAAAHAEAAAAALARSRERLERAELRLGLLDPRLPLRRGYAWLSDPWGQAVTRARQAHPGAALRATLADGEVDLTVTQRRLV